MNKASALLAGIAATLIAGALWHGPLGAGERFAARIEHRAAATLNTYEMTAVTARAERAPIARVLLLDGRADEFQRGELVRILAGIPGVERVRWADRRGKSPLPLAVEAELLALAGFGFGLVLTYLLALRRRARRWDRI